MYFDGAPRGTSAQDRSKLVMMAVIAVCRVKGLVVADAWQGRGIGDSLLDRCIRIYDRCGFRVTYGQMPIGKGLDAYYARHGFDILRPDEGLDLWEVFGVGGGVLAEPGEQLFARWHSR
jgi:GNAT superfamily N-acetyltransferase